MRFIHTLAPRAAALTLIIILAACTQATGDLPSPSVVATPDASPSAPAPSESASEEPSESPGESPADSPSPSDQPIVEHELPMIGRVLTDDVEVRTHPMADAPLVVGESFTGGDAMPEVILATGDLVVVTMGPLVNDGESWYEVASVDAGDPVFAFGWINGEAIEPDSDVPQPGPVIETIHGQGDGDAVTTDVIVGTPVSVRYAAIPMAGDDECDIEVTVTNTDGTVVEVVTETLTEIRMEAVSPFQFPALFQNEAGTVTLEVDTDCSFAASLSTPPS